MTSLKALVERASKAAASGSPVQVFSGLKRLVKAFSDGHRPRTRTKSQIKKQNKKQQGQQQETGEANVGREPVSEKKEEVMKQTKGTYLSLFGKKGDGSAKTTKTGGGKATGKGAAAKGKSNKVEVGECLPSLVRSQWKQGAICTVDQVFEKTWSGRKF